MSRIDADGSGRLSPDELVDWMVKVEREYQARDMGSKWEQADRDEDGYVTLEEYAQTISVGGELCGRGLREHAACYRWGI